MPRAAMLPNVEATLEEVPCKTNPLGVKGIGESGTIGAPPTVINALIDALRAARRRRSIDMPATPLRVWQAIEAREGKGRGGEGGVRPGGKRASLLPSAHAACRRNVVANSRKCQLGMSWQFCPGFESTGRKRQPASDRLYPTDPGFAAGLSHTRGCQ